MSDIQKYLKQPYTVMLRLDPDGDFVARIEELPGCSAHGKTRDEALENIDEAKRLWIEDCLDSGNPVPLPTEHEELPSGKWLQRVPRSLHKRLQTLSRKEGVSFNQYITSLLAEAAGERAFSREESVRTHLWQCFRDAWGAQFGGSHVEAMPPSWQYIEASPAMASLKFGSFGMRCRLSSLLPDRFEIKSRTENHEKSKHTALEHA